MRRLVTAEHDGNPAHSFAADQAHFYARLVGLDSDDRGNTGLREIHSFDPSIWSPPDPGAAPSLWTASEAAITPDRRAIVRPGADCETLQNVRGDRGHGSFPKGQEHSTVSQTPRPKSRCRRCGTLRRLAPGSYRKRLTPHKCTEPYWTSRC
jgi:hypothetical protein